MVTQPKMKASACAATESGDRAEIRGSICSEVRSDTTSSNVVDLHPVDQGPAISVFMHDGKESICAATNGAMSEPGSGVPVVAEFGSGRHLAIPFWSGNKKLRRRHGRNRRLDRLLAPSERQAIEAYLAEKYGIGT